LPKASEQGAPLHGWRARLDRLVRDNSTTKQGDGTRLRSHATRRNLRVGLFRLFSVLRDELGFGLENPARIDARHIQALIRWMEVRWQAGTLRSSTIQGYVSYLRMLCRWVGKPTLMASVAGFSNPASIRRRLACQTDRTWAGAGIDLVEVLEQAWKIEPWVAMALLAQAAFGLRRKEALCLVPEADQLPGMQALAITRGTKGGRPRVVRLHTPWQGEVLTLLCDFCRRGGARRAHLGGPAAGLKANLARYARVLARLGITRDLCGTTGHGLRADYACRLLAAHGVVAPIKSPAGAAAVAATADVVPVAYRAVSEALGHSRSSVVAAYCGAPAKGAAVPYAASVEGEDLIDPASAAEVIALLRGLVREARASQAGGRNRYPGGC
jgi:integrase